MRLNYQTGFFFLILSCLILLTSKSFAQNQSAKSDSLLINNWQQFGANQFHTNKSSFLGPSIPKVLWKHKTLGHVGSATIGADNSIYIPNNVKLMCLTTNGDFKWSYSFSDTIRQTPSIIDKTNILINTADAKLYCLSSQGKLIWNRSGYSAHTITDKYIYVNCTVAKHEGLSALNHEGRQLWLSKFSHPTQSPPAIGYNGQIYQTTQNGKLLAISPGSKLMWTYSIGSGSRACISGAPSIGLDNTIYFGASDGHLYAIKPDGKLKWRLLVDGPIEGNLALGTNDNIYLGGMFNNIIAVSSAGKILWKFRTDGYNFTAPMLDNNDNLYFLSSQHTIYSVDSKGNQRWTLRSKFPIDTVLTPAIGSNGQMIIGNLAIGN